MNFKHYLEIATKEKKAEGLWSGGKPESQEKNVIKKNIKIPGWMKYPNTEITINEIELRGFDTFQINNIKNFPQRIVIYNNTIYSASAEVYIHVDIIAWLMINRGLEKKENTLLDWVDHPRYLNNFLCLFVPNKKILNELTIYPLTLSESYSYIIEDAIINNPKILTQYKPIIKKICRDFNLTFVPRSFNSEDYDEYIEKFQKE